MLSKAKFNRLRIAKQNAYLGKRLNVSPSYLRNKLKKIGTTHEEFLRELRNEEFPERVSFKEEEVREAINMHPHFREMRDKVIKHFRIKNRDHIHVSYHIHQQGWEMLAGNRMYTARGSRVEFNIMIEFYIVSNPETGRIEIRYQNPITDSVEKFPATGTKSLLKIGDTVLHQYRDKIVPHLPRKKFARMVSKHLKKPLYAGYDLTGPYIGLGDRKYHIESNNICIPHHRKNKQQSGYTQGGWAYISDRIKEDMEKMKNPDYFRNIVKKVIGKLREQKEAEAEVLAKQKYKDKVMSSLDKIWLDFQDSLEAGNCLPGTTDMANRIKQRLGLEEDCQVSFRADEVLRTVQQYPHYNRNFENLLFRTVSRHYKSLVS